MSSILMVAGEGLPFIKTGGLADVIGSVPASLVKLGYDMSVVLPFYKKIKDKYATKFNDVFTFEKEFSVTIWYNEVPVRVYSAVDRGVKYYFVEHQGYFERDELYGYDDDSARFGYFQKAVLEMLNQLNYWPDIIHCHDWQAGMIPCMIKECHTDDKRYGEIKTIFTIHNMAFQGNFGAEVLDPCFGIPYYLYSNGNVRFDGGISSMKSAFIYADKITTVSPSYAKEILTPQYGEHMEAVLNMRRQDLQGIVNGIDIEFWNPETDPDIAAHYNLETVEKGKLENKLALQRELGLAENKDVCLVGIVGRLTWQKGFYLMMEQLNAICAAPIQLAVLGSGEREIENKLVDLENGNRGKIAFYRGYNEALAHRIYAASDLFLMPSLFEPCGLSQLCSMRYGALPLVRETGGLKDTVEPYNEFEKTGTGFSFQKYDSADLMHMLNYAIDVYYNRPEDWKMLMHNAMTKDVSWDNSAKVYGDLYNSLR